MKNNGKPEQLNAKTCEPSQMYTNCIPKLTYIKTYFQCINHELCNFLTPLPFFSLFKHNSKFFF